MKRFLLSVVLATTLALTSCQFDDSDIWGKLDEYGQSIKDHEQRISALEELCKQMNTNIEALQTLVNALEKRDYVTNVSEVRSNGEVIGYTISFAYSDTITIYHGQDGKDGANGTDGKDGYTPQIGVMKDTDGIYYWTLDGEWLLDAKGNKIKAVGTDGADGKDGQDGTNGSDGQDGQDGTNGTDGKDGITPQLKIENDYWYVSYDNGATWVQLGKATGEDGKDGQDGNDGADGSDGADGEDGDSIFKSVTQDDEYVYFNLADGTMITLPKHDKENIQFEDLQVKAICCKKWDTNNDGELSYAEAAAVETIGTVFKGNANITAFTEFVYFTSVSEVPNGAFSNCSNLWKIKLPQNLLYIRAAAFDECKNLNVYCDAIVPTVIEDNAFLKDYLSIYVDKDLVDTYKAKWTNYKTCITYIGGSRPIMVGELITIGNSKGVVFHNGDCIKLVSVESSIAQWSTVKGKIETTDMNSGYNNTAVVKSISNWETKYPAFKWCADYGENWYLPAIVELREIYNQRNIINTTLSDNGYTTFDSEMGAKPYWSSTEDNDHAYYKMFYNSNESTGSKTIEYRVLAVYAF
ncbi:MAG: leucine-rich repeat protein [Alistipes sp.]|nr:leucine-rich repeat protein [Alistipes sp.]